LIDLDLLLANEDFSWNAFVLWGSIVWEWKNNGRRYAAFEGALEDCSFSEG